MYYLQFLLSNLGRKKTRTALTFLSILVAFLLYGLLRSLVAAFEMGADIVGEDRLITLNKVSLIQPLPYAYLNKVRAIEGVELVTPANWFGGYYQEQKNQFGQFSVESDTYLKIYEDMFSVPPEAVAAWNKNRIGVVIGQGLADKFKWKVGDRVPLIGMFPQKNGSTNWEFVVEGIYTAKVKGADTSAMFIHFDYFDEARQFGEGTLGWLIIKVKNPQDSARIAAEIDTLFANSSSETKTSSEKDFAKSFAKQFGDIGLITTLILTAVFFTMLLVAGNTMAQSFRERIPELAILKAIGFADRTVMSLILMEALLISLLGGLMGLVIAKIMMVGIAEAMAATLPGLFMSNTVFLYGLALAVLFGFITGIIPALQGLRLNIVAAIRKR